MRARAKKTARAKSSIEAHPQVRSRGGRWILLLTSIPTTESSLRVKIWRQLQAVGAIALKNAVYVLPNRDGCVESFQWVARKLSELGGEASLCESNFFDGVTDLEIERRFVEARNADFAATAAEARKLIKAVKSKSTEEQIASLANEAEKLRRRFQEVVAIDFCHAAGREAAEGLVSDVERILADLRGNGQPEPLEVVARPAGGTWVTRTGVHVDRIASAWLIRRFIDPQGALKFVPAKGYVPLKGELRFDMYDAEFTHVGDRCTFEVLLARMGINDSALTAIGEIVHDLDLDDQKYGRPELVGIQSAITGICSGVRDDLERIAAATPLLEGLYTFFSLRSRKGKKGLEP